MALDLSQIIEKAQKYTDRQITILKDELESKSPQNFCRQNGTIPEVPNKLSQFKNDTGFVKCVKATSEEELPTDRDPGTFYAVVESN